MRKALVGLILMTLASPSFVLAQTSNHGEHAIRKAFDDAIAAVKRGDTDSYLAFFTDDAILADMGAGQEPVIGKKALRPWITDFVAKFTFDWTDYNSEEVLVVGDLAFHRYTGTVTVAPRSGGEVMKLQRRYVDTLRRDSKGRWKVWHHAWTARCN